MFELETVAEWVLATEPWSFDKHVVFLQHYDFSVPKKNLKITNLKFWVQMHGLPMSMLEAETTIELGGTIRRVSSSEDTNELVGGDFLRARVEIDVLKPLYRGRQVGLNNNEEVWVFFKYEKLYNFCYWCGKVSHADKECEIW